MSMVWFGQRHPAPAYSDCGQTATPVGTTCVYCSELIAMGDDGWVYADGSIMHRECHFRGIIGSAAHQQRRCSCFGGGNGNGEDEGMTRREGARAALDHFEGRR
jgi:hypothetical protein